MDANNGVSDSRRIVRVPHRKALLDDADDAAHVVQGDRDVLPRLRPHYLPQHVERLDVQPAEVVLQLLLQTRRLLPTVRAAEVVP